MRSSYYQVLDGKHILIILTVLLLGPLVDLRADEVKLAPLFSDHVVLQRNMPVPIWGSAAAGESVRVTLAGQSRTAVADNAGRWRVVLEPLNAGAAGVLVAQGKTAVTVQDVLVGDVWLCGGDAFMAKTVGSTRSARSELASKELPPVRLFRVQTVAAKEPQPEVSGSWTIPDRKSVGEFPALAYLFAKELHAETPVPVGIVEATDASPVSIQRGGKVTGSTVEAWISEATLRATPAAKPIFDFYQSPAALREALAEYENALGDWKLKTGQAFGAELRELEKRDPDVWYDYVTEMRKAGKPAPTDPPRKPTAESLRMATTHAANLHNGMIAPLAGFAVRGVVLSLGLANAPRATQYRTLFPALTAGLAHRVEPRRSALRVSPAGPRHASEPGPARVGRAARGSGRCRKPAPHGDGADHRLGRKRFSRGCADAGETPGGVRARWLMTVAELVGPSEVCDFRCGAGDREGLVRGPPSRRPIPRWRRRAHGSRRRSAEGLRVDRASEPLGICRGADRGRPGDRKSAEAEGSRRAALRLGRRGRPRRQSHRRQRPARAAVSLGRLAGVYRHARGDEAQCSRDHSARRPVPRGRPQPAARVAHRRLDHEWLLAVRDQRTQRQGQRRAAGGLRHDRRQRGQRRGVLREAQGRRLRLIHYNDGLHSLPPRITDEQFGVGLTAMLKHLKTVTPRVIWATTTPAPDRNNTLGPESQNATVITRNEMSKQIAADLGVPVNDLYGLVIADREKLQGFANLHFTPEGSKLMGEQIAARILEALGQK